MENIRKYLIVELNSTLISINEHFLTNYTTELDEVDEGRGERERSRRLELTDDDAELDFRSRSLSDMFFLIRFDLLVATRGSVKTWNKKF